jgi:UDP:flavonoid glycosyltransferase YjiC (YdhE family)
MLPDFKGKHIMVAVLNWGLGHATRSIPLIDFLLQCGAKVSIAGDGAPLKFLSEAYPTLEWHALPAYNIQYPSGFSGAWKTVFQAPAIIRAIREERLVTDQLVQQHQIDAIISDNRYGAHSDKAYSVFMCHQLNVLPPKGLRWGAPLIFRWHKTFFSKFDHIWIPDLPEQESLSGILSHGLKTDMPSTFIGPQSRFVGMKPAESVAPFPVMAMLSGPEPQRTILEEILLQQLPELDTRVLLVRGVVEQGFPIEKNHLTVVNYLHKEALFHYLNAAQWVICRPGYSTLMDLSVLGKKALLIPTPGQTEQEYLAEHLSSQGLAVVQRQNKVSLKDALENVRHIQPLPATSSRPDLLTAAMGALAENLNMRSRRQK